MSDLPTALDIGEQRAKDALIAQAAWAARCQEQREQADILYRASQAAKEAADRINAPDAAICEDELRTAARGCSREARWMLHDLLTDEPDSGDSY